MQNNIHPKWHNDAKVTCTCGNAFTTGSTLPEIHVDICSACHPFYTGEMKFIDVQGRVERFQAKMKKAQNLQQSKKQQKAVKAQKEKESQEQQTLRDVMQNLKDNQKPEAKK